jgi:hypothetical protein
VLLRYAGLLLGVKFRLLCWAAGRWWKLRVILLTSRGHRRQRWCTAAREEEGSEGLNPKSGSGLKYDQQAWGGQRRQEVEKT